MKIWIDGDSFPKPAMEVVLNFCRRKSLELIVLADRHIPQVQAAGRVLRVVSHGSGEVDEVLVKETQEGDLVVTRDFSLGIRLLEKHVFVMNDRGRVWDIKSLNRRIREAEIMSAIRAGGITHRGGSRYDSSDKKAFADALQKIISGHQPMT